MTEKTESYELSVIAGAAVAGIPFVIGGLFYSVIAIILGYIISLTVTWIDRNAYFWGGVAGLFLAVMQNYV